MSDSERVAGRGADFADFRKSAGFFFGVNTVGGCGASLGPVWHQAVSDASARIKPARMMRNQHAARAIDVARAGFESRVIDLALIFLLLNEEEY